MTIQICKGDMFESGAEALVCAANAQGRLGAGQAVEVRRRFPDQASAFSAECRTGSIRPGTVFWCTEAPDPRILFVAVKDDPRQPSRIEWVRKAAEQLRLLAIDAKLRSVAVPALGCGLGRLRWADVRPIMERMASGALGVRWMLYEPHGGA